MADQEKKVDTVAIHARLLENYGPEIDVFLALFDTIEEEFKKNGSLAAIQNTPASENDRKFAAIAFGGGDAPIEDIQYMRRMLISSAARLQKVVETGNDPKILKWHYEVFKKACQRKGGWLWFENRRQAREIVRLNAEINKLKKSFKQLVQQ